MKSFDEYIKECEEKYPEEMEAARVWAKEFIAKWKEDPGLVETEEYNLDMDWLENYMNDRYYKEDDE